MVHPIVVSTRPRNNEENTYELMEAFGCTQTSRSSTNDQHIHRTRTRSAVAGIWGIGTFIQVWHVEESLVGKDE